MKKLSKEAKSNERRLKKDFQLNSQEEVLLQEGLENFDEFRTIEKLVAKEGLILTDAKGRKYIHPGTQWIKVCKNNYLRCLKAIGFTEAIKRAKRDVGRPPEHLEASYGGDEET